MSAVEAACDEGTVGWCSPVYTADFGSGDEQLAPAANAVVLNHADVADAEDVAAVTALGLVRDEVRSSLLGELDYFTVADPVATPAYDLQERIADALGRDVEVRLEWVPMRVPVAYTPNDPMYADQWNLRQIGAGGTGTSGWDLTQGSATQSRWRSSTRASSSATRTSSAASSTTASTSAPCPALAHRRATTARRVPASWPRAPTTARRRRPGGRLPTAPDRLLPLDRHRGGRGIRYAASRARR